MQFTIFQDSRQGARNNNEDRAAYSYSRDALIMVIADGMGGHHFGEIASQIAVQSLIESFQQSAKPQIEDPFSFLQKKIHMAHNAIVEYARVNKLADSPRTTIVACIIQNSVAYWAHAGDSRLYLFRDGKIIAQTRDHSHIRLLVEEGIVSESQAARHPDRNKIYSCVGSQNMIPEIDFSRKVFLQKNDTVLLATDGLWGPLTSEQICETLRYAELTEALPILLDMAEAHAGSACDNLSVVAVHWEDENAENDGHSISTASMKMNDVTTQMEEFGRQAHHKQELNDDEIEAAIKEIRDAIGKYNPP